MRQVAAGVLVFLLAACTSLMGTNPDKGAEIIISQFPEQRELDRFPLGPKKNFSLSFIHSVSKTRVTDIYEIREGQIIQTKEIFQTHGAGLPSNIDDPGGIFWEKTKDNFILHMERPIPKLVVRTDKSYQNRLGIDAKTINLNQWDDQALLIYIEPL